MSVTHTPTHKRANDYRGRHGMSVSLNVGVSRIRGRATRMKGGVEKQRRIVKPTTLRPSHQAYRRPRSENPRPLRHCGLRLTLAARRRRSRRARQTLDMGWFGWASRPLLRPLLGARRTTASHLPWEFGRLRMLAAREPWEADCEAKIRPRRLRCRRTRTTQLREARSCRSSTTREC